MDKRLLIKQLTEKLSADLAVLTQAAMMAHEAATHTESKAEDQYDTRGLEASYLAGAQSKRAMEVQETLDQFRHLDIRQFDAQTAIASTALVELRGEADGRHVLYLMMPSGGGMSAEFEGRIINVITPKSPMGQALLGRRVGDAIEVEVQRNIREYEVVQIW